MISAEEKQAVIDLFPFMGENPVVFDVGSNKGNWADVILGEYKENCSLHIVEPNDKLRSFAEIKYEYNKNITYWKFPFYKESTVLQFHYFENYNNELSSIYDGGEKWEGLPKKTKSVQTTTLDEYCGMKDLSYVDYLKVDTEGSDLDVLLGALKMLSENKIGIIQIEYSEHWQRGNHTWQELKSIAEKYGYKIYRYIDRNFWGEKSETPEYDNYYLTKFEIHNYCIAGSNDNFVINTSDLPPLDLVIEVGCMEGITTKYICENLLNKENPDARVICVDPLFDYYVKDDPRYHPEFKGQYPRFIRNTRGLPVNLKRGKSQDELPKLHALRVSLCYIDGDHYSPMPYLDGVWCFAITKIGSYILFDDYEWCEETKESIDKFLNEFQGHYELIRKNYQVLIKKTSNHYNELTQNFYL